MPDTGSIKFNFPDLEPDEMKDSCALDVAEEHGITLEDTGAVMNVTRERVRQIEEATLQKLTEMEDELPDGHDWDATRQGGNWDGL